MINGCFDQSQRKYFGSFIIICMYDITCMYAVLITTGKEKKVCKKIRKKKSKVQRAASEISQKLVLIPPFSSADEMSTSF